MDSSIIYNRLRYIWNDNPSCFLPGNKNLWYFYITEIEILGENSQKSQKFFYPPTQDAAACTKFVASQSNKVELQSNLCY